MAAPAAMAATASAMAAVIAAALAAAVSAKHCGAYEVIMGKSTKNKLFRHPVIKIPLS